MFGLVTYSAGPKQMMGWLYWPGRKTTIPHFLRRTLVQFLYTQQENNFSIETNLKWAMLICKRECSQLKIPGIVITYFMSSRFKPS